MNLRALQTEFQQCLLNTHGQVVDSVRQSATGLAPRARMAIYHNAYRARLHDVLCDTYETTHTYLGDEWFDQLASDFIESHHSEQANIGKYGHQFSHYLANVLPNDTEVAELAVMDWTLRRAFDGKDCEVIASDELGAMAQQAGNDLRLTLVPTLSQQQQQFNTMRIWQAINNEETPPEVQRLAQSADILFWRKGYSPHFRSVSALEAVALTGVQSGKTLEQVGTELAEKFVDIDVVTEVGMLLRRWVDEQLLAKISSRSDCR